MTAEQAWIAGHRADATARAVIECAADAIVAFGTDRTVMLWNPAAERMFGWSAAEVVGLEPQIIPEELKAEHNAVLERVRGGGQISFATRRIRKDSTIIDLRIDTSALLDSAGEVTGWVNVCHQTGEDDVARHYMAERARVVRRLGDVVADMNAQRDLESVLDRIAASLRELTSADAGGFVIIEDDMLKLVSTAGLPARLRGRTATLSRSLVGELMQSGKTVMMATGESGNFDDLIWSALPGLHTIALSLSHVAGKPYGALYALYSRRRLSHVELELLELLAGHAGVALTNAMAFEEVVKQRAHERAVIDGSADGIAVLDAAGLVRQWNPAAHRITGTPAQVAIGKPPPFPLPEPDAMLTHKLPNGRWLDVLCTALPDGDELVIDFRDVTAAKELEEAKDLFLATTSHELRTPITVVQGFASTLASRWDQLADPERRAAVRTIAERAGSLGRLVEQLLLGARAGADQLPVSNGPFDLAAVLRGAATAFRPLSDKHTVVADIPDDLPAASGDTMATDIIVGQLLENAFKYSPDGGTVTVRARINGDLDRGHGRRRGHRHRRRGSRAHLRPVLPGRDRRPPPVRRRRHRPVHRPPPGRGPARRDHRPLPPLRRHRHAPAPAPRPPSPGPRPSAPVVPWPARTAQDPGSHGPNSPGTWRKWGVGLMGREGISRRCGRLLRGRRACAARRRWPPGRRRRCRARPRPASRSCPSPAR